MSIDLVDGKSTLIQRREGPLLLTWFKFNPNKDQSINPL